MLVRLQGEVVMSAYCTHLLNYARSVCAACEHQIAVCTKCHETLCECEYYWWECGLCGSPWFSSVSDCDCDETGDDPPELEERVAVLEDVIQRLAAVFDSVL